MPDRYTLPPELGGGEVESLGNRGLPDGRFECRVPGRIPEDTARIPAAWLTPVASPLPPEPPDGAVVRLGTRGPLFARYDTSDEGLGPGERHWVGYDPSGKLIVIDWAAVREAAKPGVPVLLVPDRLALAENLSDEDLDIACCIEWFEEHGSPLNAAAIRRLVAQRDALLAADPFAEPVELPAKFGRLSIVVSNTDTVSLVEMSPGIARIMTELSPAAARELARAVLAAATQAERPVLDERRRRYVEWVVEREREIMRSGISDHRPLHGPAPLPPSDLAPLERICRYCHEDWPCSTTQAGRSGQ